MFQNELLLIFVLLVLCPLFIYLAMPAKGKKDLKTDNDEPSFKHLVTIASFRSPGEAHVARGMLESAGIEAHLANEFLSTVRFDYVLADGGLHLKVREADAEVARELLANKETSSSSEK